MVEIALLFTCLALVGTGIALWRCLQRLRETPPPTVRSDASELPLPGGMPGSEILSGLLDTLSEACFIIDERQRIAFANDAVSTVFGGLVPRPGSPLGSVINDHKILDLVDEAANSGLSAEREFTLVNGTTRFLQCTVVPITLSGESATRGYLSLVVRDTTVERDTEQIRKDFVANASHELRTPLSIINGYLENLLDGIVEPGEEMSQALGTMARHGERIARIVEDMLTISRFESNDAESLRHLRAETFDLAACAGDVIGRLAPVIAENKTITVVEISPAASTLAGDRGYWDQVLFNLVDNAIKENTGGPITVTISAEIHADGGHLISVSDNGVGIPAAHVPFVFKRFYRVAKHHSNNKIKGTGLGLSIVKRAVEAHGGSIVLTSSPGIETKFAIAVPPLEQLALDRAT